MSTWRALKKVMAMRDDPNTNTTAKEISDQELRKILREEMRQAQRMQKSSIRQGDLSRFYQ